MSKQPVTPPILNSPDLRVVSMQLVHEQELRIEVESIRTAVACRKCWCSIDQFDSYEPPRRLQFRPPQGYAVAIVVRLKRFRCPYCRDHPTTIQQIDWPDAEFGARCGGPAASQS